MGVDPRNDLRCAMGFQSFFDCLSALLWIPRASLGDTPLKDGQVTLDGCGRAAFVVPGAAIFPSVLEHIQMASLSCPRARAFVPGAPSLVSVL